MSNSSIWSIDRTLLGATTPGQSVPGNDGNEGVLSIPQSSSITGASLSESLASYPGHLLGVVLPLCRDAVGVFYSVPAFQPTGLRLRLSPVSKVLVSEWSLWFSELQILYNHHGSLFSQTDAFSFICSQFLTSSQNALRMFLTTSLKHFSVLCLRHVYI